MRRRVEQHVPARLAERELKLGPGWPARRRVLRAAAAARARTKRRHAAQPDDDGRPRVARDVGLRRARAMPPLWPTPTDSCARSSTESSCTACGARTRCPRTRPSCAGSGARWAFGRIPSANSSAPGTGTPARCDGCTRSSSTDRCSRPWPGWTPGEARLSLEAAEQRLEALGYVDPASALRHLQALTAGVSRRAAIQRTLLPVMLGWFADAPDPDAGLLGFRRVSDALGATHWYLRLLRDESAAAERLARVLSTSQYATDLLLQAPESVSLLADDADLRPRPREALLAEVHVGRRPARGPGERRVDDSLDPTSRALPHRRGRAPPRRRPRAGGHGAHRRGRRRHRGSAGRGRGRRSTRRARVTSPSSAWVGSAARSSASPATSTSCSCTSRGRASMTRRRCGLPPRSRRSFAGCSWHRAAIRRSTSTPTCGPRASRARSCGRSAPTRPTTSDGVRRGRRRRCCVPRSSPATTTSGRPSWTSSTPCGGAEP